MARVIYGAGVEDLIGRIGGTVFSKNAAGSFARSISHFPFRSTPRRLNRLPDLLLFYTHWSSLSPFLHMAWRDYAKSHVWKDNWGVISKPSGYNAFVHVNYNRALCDENILFSPPVFSPPPECEGVAISYDVNSWKIVGIDPLGTSDYFYFFYITAPHRYGSLYVKSKLKFLIVIQCPVSIPFNLQPALNEYFNFIYPSPGSGTPPNFSVSCHAFLVSKINGLSGLGFTFTFPYI